jgi:hypothetical protein
MGGHHSKQTASATADTVASAMVSATDQCVTTINTGNAISIGGANSSYDNLNQSVTASVDAKCAMTGMQSSDTVTKMSASISQSMQDQGIAGTQWMDGSKSTISSYVANRTSSMLSSTAVAGVTAALSGQNAITSTGTGVRVSNVTQTDRIGLVSESLLQQAQTASAISDVTAVMNQYSKSTTTNPFSFITDAIGALGKLGLEALALPLVMLIVVLLLFKFLLSGGGAASGGSEYLGGCGGLFSGSWI